MAPPARTVLRLTLTATTLAALTACTQPAPANPGPPLPTTSAARTTTPPRPALTRAATAPTLTATPVQPAPDTRPTATTTRTPHPKTPAAPTPSTACPTPATTVLRTTPNTRTRTVAFTFDDGPGKDTPAILAILAKHHIHATFFMIGRNAKAHPTWARQVATAGHAIGNHTYDHPLAPGMNRLPTTTQATQIDKATRAIRAATGATPCYFRAPGGNDKNPTTLTLARARHMTIANWAYDPRDWAAPAYPSRSYTAHIVANATGTKEHPIVLMHDGGGNRTNTIAALDQVIRYYQSRGYTFTTPDGRPFPAQPSTPKPSPRPTPASKPAPTTTTPAPSPTTTATPSPTTTPPPTPTQTPSTTSGAPFTP